MKGPRVDIEVTLGIHNIVTSDDVIQTGEKHCSPDKASVNIGIH